MKTCTKCKAEKPLDQFSKDGQKKDGLSCWCRTCSALRLAAYRAENPEKIKEGQANHYRANKDKRIADVVAYRKANPEKIKALNAGMWKENKDKYSVISKAWRDANKEKIKQANTTYYEKNGHLMRAKINQFRSENPELMRQKEAEKRARNPLIHRAQDALRRARKHQAQGKYTAADIKSLMVMQKGKCVVCRCDIRKKFHIDHIESLARGGGNCKYNIQLLCRVCNQNKHAKDPVSFMQSKGYLL